MQRKIIQIDEDKCDGCGQCIIGCAEGALEIIDGKAKLVAEKYCDGLGACLGECPQDALQVIEREADEFDEDAVEERLDELKAKGQAPEAKFHRSEPKTAPSQGGCPGAQAQSMTPGKSGGCPGSRVESMQPGKMQPGKPMAGFTPGPSALTHWPIQLRLVPPTADFLKDANVLLAADCTAASLPNFNSHFLPGKVLLMGCPKFDDADSYIEKLTAIITENEIKSFTVLEMEVPCCSGLHRILGEAMKRAGCRVPAELTIIARNGDVKGTKPIPADKNELEESCLNKL